MRRNVSIIGAVIGLAAMAAPAAAEDQPETQLPAVSGFNAFAQFQFGFNHPRDAARNQDNSTRFLLEGKVAFPLNFGFSGDRPSPFGMKIEVRHRGGQGGEFTHLRLQPIWRDPDFGHVSVHLTLRNSEQLVRENDAILFGVTGGIYLDNVELRAFYTGTAGQSRFINTVGFDAFYYPIENLNIGAGYIYSDVHSHFGRQRNRNSENHSLTWRVEWMFFSDSPVGMSLLLRGSHGISDTNEGAYGIFGGIRIFWGPETKTLMRRQREDMY